MFRRCLPRGGGNSGPSSADPVKQKNAAKARAQAEADEITAQIELDKQTENIKVVGDQAQLANDDEARRIRNRTLLAGIENDEIRTSAPTLKTQPRCPPRKLSAPR